MKIVVVLLSLCCVGGGLIGGPAAVRARATSQPFDKDGLTIEKLPGDAKYRVKVADGFDFTTLDHFKVWFDTEGLEAVPKGVVYNEPQYDVIEFDDPDFVALRSHKVFETELKDKTLTTVTGQHDEGETFEFQSTDADWDKTAGTLAKGFLYFHIKLHNPGDGGRKYNVGKAWVHIDFK